MNKDTVVGIVGAVILVGAMVGVFYYEGTQASALGAERYTVNFPNKAGTIPAVSGATAEGASTPQTIAVNVRNLTSIEFSLEWTDDEAGTAADTFTITVTSPDGLVTDTKSGASPLKIAFDSAKLGQSAPEPRTETGRNQADASQKVAGSETRHVGHGDWTVSIKLDTAGKGTCLAPPVGCPQGQGDSQNSWTLKTSYTAYEAQLLASESTS